SLQTLVDEYLAVNGSTSGVECRVVITGTRRGYVIVGGDEDVQFAFGPAIGQSGSSDSGVSVAAIRTDPGGGIRPIGVCAVERTLNLNPSTGSPYSLHADVIEGAKQSDGQTLVQPVDAFLSKEHLKKDIDGCGVADASGQRGQLDLGNNGGGDGG